MAVIVTSPINGRADDLNELSFPTPRGKLNRLPAAPAAPERRSSPSSSGRRRAGTGTRSAAARRVAAATDWAEESCPEDETWHLLGWNDLYGD